MKPGTIILIDKKPYLVFIATDNVAMLQALSYGPCNTENEFTQIYTDKDLYYFTSSKRDGLSFGVFNVYEEVDEIKEEVLQSLLRNIEIIYFIADILQLWQVGGIPSWAKTTTDTWIEYLQWAQGKIRWPKKSLV